MSHSISSGFVEGNNNKFKLIKRIVYGRSGLVNLSKKCLLAF
ncbi:transposase, partial [Enterococcus avium]